ncbi:832_t:CDS:2, partial [Paraglomus brasilianum]
RRANLWVISTDEIVRMDWFDDYAAGSLAQSSGNVFGYIPSRSKKTIHPQRSIVSNLIGWEYVDLG